MSFASAGCEVRDKGCEEGCDRIANDAKCRAGEGIRTLDVHLGKVALYH